MSFGFLWAEVFEPSFASVPALCFLEAGGVGVGEAVVSFVVVRAEGVAAGSDPVPPFDFCTAREVFLGSAALGWEIRWMPIATRARRRTTAAAPFLRFHKELVASVELAVET